MLDQIKNLLAEVETDGKNISDADQVEAYRIKYLGRKGLISAIFEKMASVPKEEKGQVGKALNELKNKAQSIVDDAASKFQKKETEQTIDLTLPATPFQFGKVHPLTQTLNEMIEIFRFLGFSIASGPEIEHDWYNFEALNFAHDEACRLQLSGQGT